jgi:hypothetical protein
VVAFFLACAGMLDLPLKLKQDFAHLASSISRCQTL